MTLSGIEPAAFRLVAQTFTQNAKDSWCFVLTQPHQSYYFFFCISFYTTRVTVHIYGDARRNSSPKFMLDARYRTSRSLF